MPRLLRAAFHPLDGARLPVTLAKRIAASSKHVAAFLPLDGAHQLIRPAPILCLYAPYLHLRFDAVILPTLFVPSVDSLISVRLLRYLRLLSS